MNEQDNISSENSLGATDKQSVETGDMVQAEPEIEDRASSVPKRKSTLKIVIALVVPGIFVAVGGLAIAGYIDLDSLLSLFGKKQSYTTYELFYKSLANIGTIHSTAYNIEASFVSEPRGDNEYVLDIIVTDDLKELNEPYERDSARFRGISQIQNQLRGVYTSAGAYPEEIDYIDLIDRHQGFDVVVDSFEYGNADEGNSYLLVVEFETNAAIDSLKDSYYADNVLILDNKRVQITDGPFYATFRKKSPLFALFESAEDQEKLFSFLPVNINISAFLSGQTRKEDKTLPDTRFHLGVSVDMEDFLLSADAELIKKGDVFYVRVNKMPSLFFFDLSAIKKKWIKIIAEDLGATGSSFLPDFDDIVERQEEKSKLFIDQLSLIFSIAKKEKYLHVDEISVADSGGVNNNLKTFKITIPKEKIIPAYTTISKKLGEGFGDDAFITYDDEIVKALESESFSMLYDYLNNNASFIIAIDERLQLPISFEYTQALVPKESLRKYSEVKYVTSISFLMSDINKKVDIDRPKEFMSYEEAAILLSGMSVEEFRFNKQLKNIRDIRKALKTYFEITKIYPTALENLIISAKELAEQTGGSLDNITDFRVNRDHELKLLEFTPKDVVTEKEYIYESKIGVGDQNDYVLKYSIVLPEYKPGTLLPYAIKKRSGKIDSLSHINGENTANSTYISVEANEEAFKDSDADLLSDVLEVYIGTETNNADTDGDGYDDGKEVRGRHDPLGPGELK